MHTKTNPIGLFDSGIGGTSIWKEIHALLPHEDTIYLADSKNAPYGQKSKEEIIELSFKNTRHLLSRGAKIIVVACNTATTNAIKELRAAFDVPFIGIEPAIKPAAISTQTGSIGILATKGTLTSELFAQKVSELKDVNIIEQVGYNLVALIEDGKLNSPEIKELLVTYLKPMIDANIDYLVLGCSHYPYLVPQIKEILPKGVHIIDSGEAVARQTRSILHKHNLLNETPKAAESLFYANNSPAVLQSIIGPEYTAEHLDF
ncbi:glutamate racemase [Flavobacterium akiainvivens]|uniref:Glutamate racemase n=1 Tax=Flavobacterium akiainvivens TaxID=1202724 RepID=A0A0M9VJ76_9FLAO|nr:glutamate racemase [Flavobacterium akiainvivens]KOS07446.1 glutamate racemase [Flavobacterium akiainvivens]SFQ63010.1 glutamate racemase [Flavobacterium akiainvivens]